VPADVPCVTANSGQPQSRARPPRLPKSPYAWPGGRPRDRSGRKPGDPSGRVAGPAEPAISASIIAPPQRSVIHRSPHAHRRPTMDARCGVITHKGPAPDQLRAGMCLASPYGCAPFVADKESCARSPGSSRGVSVTAKTLTPIAALVLAIGIINRADVLLKGNGQWCLVRAEPASRDADHGFIKNSSSAPMVASGSQRLGKPDRS
jgi:hypothetical protein